MPVSAESPVGTVSEISIAFVEAKVETNPDILSLGFLLLRLESSADPEHVAIWMTKVHLTDVPRHIGGRKCDPQPGGDALLVHLVHVVNPN